MIVGTNANCKLLNITVTDSKATITLLIFSTLNTVPSKPFRIVAKDLNDNSTEYVNDNIYWIDQINNYNYDSKNVDINKYKEIVFQLDISKKNTSEIQGNRWIRKCFIQLLDGTKGPTAAAAWTSEALTLISEDFEIPEIKNISFDTTEIFDQFGKIKCKFNLDYKSQEDFNYNNKNFNAFINVRSVNTNNILETKEIHTSAIGLYNEITTTNEYKLGDRIVIQLLITNKNGDIVRNVRKIYRPSKKHSNTFVKTSEGIKRAIAIYTLTDAQNEHEGEWKYGDN